MIKMKNIFQWLDGGFRVRFFKEDVNDFYEVISEAITLPGHEMGLLEYRFKNGFHFVEEDNGESILAHKDRAAPNAGLFGLVEHAYLDLPAIIRKYGGSTRLALPFLKLFDVYKEERPLPILDLTLRGRNNAIQTSN